MSSVAVFAHRGASGSHPENTAAAFGEALRLGVEAIEFDVRMSADRQMIVCHDATVDRTSDGSGEIRKMSLAQIKELDAGGWFGGEFAGERFLTLAEALDLLNGDVRLNIHVIRRRPRPRDTGPAGRPRTGAAGFIRSRFSRRGPTGAGFGAQGGCPVGNLQFVGRTL